jgi:hypothetical protein
MECLALSTQCSTDLVHVLTKQNTASSYASEWNSNFFLGFTHLTLCIKGDYEEQSAPEALLNPLDFLEESVFGNGIVNSLIRYCADIVTTV